MNVFHTGNTATIIDSLIQHAEWFFPDGMFSSWILHTCMHIEIWCHHSLKYDNFRHFETNQYIYQKISKADLQKSGLTSLKPSNSTPTFLKVWKIWALTD